MNAKTLLKMPALDFFNAVLKQRKMSPKTLFAYDRAGRAFLEWLGGRPLKKCGPADITAWQASLEGYAPATVEQWTCALARFFSVLGECGHREAPASNPVGWIHAVRRREADSNPTGSLCASGWEALNEAITKRKDRLLAMLLYYGGLRVAEAASLKCGDFDAKTGILEFVSKGRKAPEAEDLQVEVGRAPVGGRGRRAGGGFQPVQAGPEVAPAQDGQRFREGRPGKHELPQPAARVRPADLRGHGGSPPGPGLPGPRLRDSHGALHRLAQALPGGPSRGLNLLHISRPGLIFRPGRIIFRSCPPATRRGDSPASAAALRAAAGGGPFQTTPVDGRGFWDVAAPARSPG